VANLVIPAQISSGFLSFFRLHFVIAPPRRTQRSLALDPQIGIVRYRFTAMTSRNANARAMIIGMIIIRRRPGHGHIA
jgi:hypothetical protein